MLSTTVVLAETPACPLCPMKGLLHREVGVDILKEALWGIAVDSSTDVASIVTSELLAVREKVQGLLYAGNRLQPDAHDAYVSALIGHLFAMLLARPSPATASTVATPEALVTALNIIAKKMSAVAQSLDRSADYRVQILRREKGEAPE